MIRSKCSQAQNLRCLLTNALGARSNFADITAVEIIDLRISYQTGAPIAYLRPLTMRGRHWLWDRVKYPYVGLDAIVEAEQLLTLLQGIGAQEVTIHWKS